MRGSLSWRPYCGPLRGVIFDWAGTLVDFGSRAPVLAVEEAFRRAEVDVTEAEIRAPMGMAKREHLSAMMGMPRIADAWLRRYGKLPDEAAIDRVYGDFLSSQAELLAANSDLIPGALESVADCRRRGLRLGSSTGYTAELLKPIVEKVRRLGVELDAAVSADDAPAGRPAPWMCFENARRMNVFPMAALVKIDDTTVGVEAGLNAGAWAVGVAASGNLVGLSAAELNQLPRGERDAIVARAAETLYQAGAHLVIDTIAELPAALDALEAGLAEGRRP